MGGIKFFAGWGGDIKIDLGGDGGITFFPGWGGGEAQKIALGGGPPDFGDHSPKKWL